MIKGRIRDCYLAHVVVADHTVPLESGIRMSLEICNMVKT